MMGSEHPTDELSDAIVLYVGWKIRPIPDFDLGRVVARYGADRGSALVAQYRTLVDTAAVSMKSRGSPGNSLEAAKRIVANVLEAYPSMTADASSALKWAISYSLDK